jgi:hypothetical protein
VEEDIMTKPIRALVFGFVSGAALMAFQAPAYAAASVGELWLGSDGNNIVYHYKTDGTLLGTFVPGVPNSGEAFDGSHLYVSSAFNGTIQIYNANGTVLQNTKTAPLPPGSGSGSEDLAWDTTRNSLWRIDHFAPFIDRIDPTSGTVLNSFALPTTDPGFITNLGGLGIAYNPTTDKLYVSFCEAGCATFSKGEVRQVNPATGADEGLLFRTVDDLTGGLAYDQATNTLWMGLLSHGPAVANFALDGTQLTAAFPTGNFADGLEFIGQAPEPATLTLLALSLAGLAASRRRKLQ